MIEIFFFIFFLIIFSNDNYRYNYKYHKNAISNSFKKLKQIGKLSDEIGIFNIYNIKNDPLERLLGIFNTKNETIFLDIKCPQIKNILDLENSVIYLTYITKL